MNDELETGLAEMDGERDCLLVLEVHNDSLSQTFQAELARLDGSGWSIKAQIEADATFNLLLPVKRLFLSSDDIAKPIPSLSIKQFVVGKDKTTAIEKEMFWYRKALLSKLRLTWREMSTQTIGEAWLQDAEFTESMLNALKLDEYALAVSLLEGDQKLEQGFSKAWCAACEHFYQVKCTVRDRRGMCASDSVRWI